MEPMDTRDRILKVAFELFAKRSYAKVSMDDIAREAGVSKGGLFHHFPSKYILARECLFSWIQSMMGEYLSPEYRRKTDPKERIAAILDLATVLPDTEIQYFRFFMDLYNEVLDDPREKARWTGFIGHYVELLAYDLQELGSSDPKTKALIMLATLDGMGLYQLIIKDEPWFDRDAIRKEFGRMFEEE